MPDSHELSELGHEELVVRFLSVTDVPENEWPQQIAKLLGFNRLEIERALAFYETESDRVATEIVVALPLWEKEEGRRKELSASGLPKIRSWLKAAIQTKSKNPAGEAFLPFQDEVRNETAYDDLYMLYLGLSEIDRLSWNEAIVDVAAEFLRDSPNSDVTDGLLHLVQCINELPKLALTALAPLALLQAHCAGKVALTPMVTLSVFRDGCWRFLENWNGLFTIGDKIFADYLDAGMLENSDFTKAGEQVIRQLGLQTAEDLAECVAAPYGWRRFFLAPMLTILDPPQAIGPPKAGLRLGPDKKFQDLLRELTAFSSQIEANYASGLSS